MLHADDWDILKNNAPISHKRQTQTQLNSTCCLQHEAHRRGQPNQSGSSSFDCKYMKNSVFPCRNKYLTRGKTPVIHATRALLQDNGSLPKVGAALSKYSNPKNFYITLVKLNTFPNTKSFNYDVLQNLSEEDHFIPQIDSHNTSNMAHESQSFPPLDPLPQINNNTQESYFSSQSHILINQNIPIYTTTSTEECTLETTFHKSSSKYDAQLIHILSNPANTCSKDTSLLNRSKDKTCPLAMELEFNSNHDCNTQAPTIDMLTKINFFPSFAHITHHISASQHSSSSMEIDSSSAVVKQYPSHN